MKPLKTKHLSYNETDKCWDIVCDNNANRRVTYGDFEREYFEGVRLIIVESGQPPVAMLHSEWCEWLNLSFNREELKARLDIVLNLEEAKRMVVYRNIPTLEGDSIIQQERTFAEDNAANERIERDINILGHINGIRE